MRKPMIYQYDKKSNIERLVDIYDICRKNNLYEMRNNSGKIMDTYHNVIEKIFASFERDWDNILNKVEHNEYLSDNDKILLSVLIPMQFMRTPESLSLLNDMLFKACQNENYPISKNDLDRYIKASTFIWTEPFESNNWIIDRIIDMMLTGKKIIIYISKKPFILNGTRPTLHMKLHYALEDRWYFPVSKHYCLSLVDENANTPLYMHIPDAMTDIINDENIANEGRCVYGSTSIKDI